MKKILTGFAIISLLVLQSCLKSEENVDFSNLGYITQILWPPVASASAADATGSGLTYFGSGALTYPPSDEVDTAFFIVNLAGTNSTMTKDLPITIGVDASKLNDNFSSDSITYETMPDSVYKILNTTGVIPAGKRLDTFYVVFYPSKFDPSKNFGLPITITAAPGTTISSNFGTLYIHTIGNPIAGVYENEWIRWNTLDTSGAPTFDEDEGGVILAPVNPTTVSVSNATGITYVISFTNTGGTLTDFTASLDPASVASAGITITSGPFVDIADPINGIYRFRFTYLNSTGAARTIVDSYIR